MWDVPVMKVGTLDSLMLLSDDLSRTDGLIEGIARKAERALGDAYAASSAPGSGKGGPAPALRVGALTVADAIKRFAWDQEQFDPQVRAWAWLGEWQREALCACVLDAKP